MKRIKYYKMKKLFSLRKEFDKSFNLESADSPQATPKNLPDLLNFHLLQEELDEYKKAVQERNTIEVFDALVDLQYVLLGAIRNHGLEDIFMSGFIEVHESNMSKLDSNGKPIYIYNEIGKVMKGENYFKPELKKFLGL